MQGAEVAIAAIGLVTAVLTLVVRPLFKLLADNTKATNAQATAAESQAKAMEALVAETRKGNKEAKQRNGHLGEQNIQITELITKMGTDMKSAADRNHDAIVNVKEQHVQHQTVNKEVVKEKR